ncbi:hypothetical protein D8674_041046 [Pyrus ussuriensis x Pyrus communis]|uniref:Uncharacterized protein n=1 Tax=Pyrus ussuriensis x Pyrus communis TaxID=2448454 RepID=A0A5N5FBX4_9ROSA|nr:hypothetical protein D8674_041046 [Pyrus ussuriensis x Pyrus communis]
MRIATIYTSKILLCFFSIVTFLLLLVIHVYIIVFWHLTRVVSMLKPVYGFTFMKRSHEVFKKRVGMAFVLVFEYLTIYRVDEVPFSGRRCTTGGFCEDCSC